MDTYQDIIQEICERYGWEYDSPETLICECGEMHEYDGTCSECGPSPLLREGII